MVKRTLHLKKKSNFINKYKFSFKDYLSLFVTIWQKNNIYVYLYTYDEILDSHMQNVATFFFKTVTKHFLRTKTSCGLKKITISSKTSLITFLNTKQNAFRFFLHLTSRFNDFFSSKECSTYRYYSARRKRSLIMITIMMIGIGGHTYITSSKGLGGLVHKKRQVLLTFSSTFHGSYE